MTPPDLGPSAPLHLLLNPGSGRSDAGEVRDAIVGVLSAAGRDHEIHVPAQPAEIGLLAHTLAERALAEGGVVVAVGGDGTLNAVAQAAWERGAIFGALPQGTFNYFGRSHGIADDAAEATRSLLTGHVHPVQLGCVTGGRGRAGAGAGESPGTIFLVNASLGLYPEILEDREAFQKRHGRSRVLAMLAMLSTLMGRQRPLKLTLEHAGAELTMRALTLFVCNNRLQLEQLGIAEATALDEGELVALLLQPVKPLEMAGIVLRGALGRLGEAERVLRFGFSRLGARPSRMGRRRIKVAIDGEVKWLDAPLSFSVAARPLWLIKPDAARHG